MALSYKSYRCASWSKDFTFLDLSHLTVRPFLLLFNLCLNFIKEISNWRGQVVSAFYMSMCITILFERTFLYNIYILFVLKMFLYALLK